jgi:hypothetical protein
MLQDHSRGGHDLGLHRVCDPLSQRETRLELSRAVRLLRRRRILRICFQGTRTLRLNGCQGTSAGNATSPVSPKGTLMSPDMAHRIEMALRNNRRCHWIGHPCADSPAFNPHHGSPFSPPKTRAVTALEIYLDRLKPSAPTQPMALGT